MFSKAKRGDEVWHFAKGWGVVKSVEKRELYPVVVEFKGKIRISFLLDGRENINDINPSLFWDEIQLKKAEDEEIMNLLKERLEPLGIYDFSEYYFLSYTHTTKTWTYGSGFGGRKIGPLAFKVCPASQFVTICRELNHRNVSYYKFIEICKKLGWL